MWYSLESTPGVYFKLDIDTVQQLMWMNKQGQKPEALGTYTVVEEKIVDESKHEDLVGHVSLTSLEEKDRKNRQGNRNRNQNRQQPQNRNQQQNRPKDQPKDSGSIPQQNNTGQGNNQPRKNPNNKFRNRNPNNKGPKDKPNE